MTSYQRNRLIIETLFSIVEKKAGITYLVEHVISRTQKDKFPTLPKRACFINIKTIDTIEITNIEISIIIRKVTDVLYDCIENGCTAFILDVAPGIHMLVCEVVLSMRRFNPMIYTIVREPNFQDQILWTKPDILLYRIIGNQANDIIKAIPHSLSLPDIDEYTLFEDLTKITLEL